MYRDEANLSIVQHWGGIVVVVVMNTRQKCGDDETDEMSEMRCSVPGVMQRMRVKRMQ